LLVAGVTVIAALSAFDFIGASKRVGAATAVGVVNFYGDSLMGQMRNELQFQLGLDGINSNIHYFGGTALCDWIPTIQNQVDSVKPTLVVIEFSGNALTPCMAGDNTEATLVAKYRSDLTYVADWLHVKKVPLMVVAGPPGIGPTGQPVVIPTTWAVGQIPQGYAPKEAALNEMYQTTVGEYQRQGWYIGFIAADQAVSSPDGNWTYVLPCLSFETASMGCDAKGLIVVRAPDYAHFCPIPIVAPGGPPECGIWDAGAWRYASAISKSLNTALAAHNRHRPTVAIGGAYNPRPGSPRTSPRDEARQNRVRTGDKES
jgi:hypothetical protein